MSDEKVSFLLYNEWGEYIRMLTIEERGKLLTAIFDFQDTGELPAFDGQLKMAFAIMTKQFNRDSKKWIEQKAKRSAAGKKGAEARWDIEKSLESKEIAPSLDSNKITNSLDMVKQSHDEKFKL